jgi:hypothetical protein
MSMFRLRSCGAMLMAASEVIPNGSLGFCPPRHKCKLRQKQAPIVRLLALAPDLAAPHRAA